MGFWGSLAMSWKFAIVLGSAIVLTFCAGLIRLAVMRRRLIRDQKREDLEAAEKSGSRVALTGRTLGEGDLFGVRAIQSGFYGGVSQITLTPPDSSASSPRSTPIVINSDSNQSLGSSATDLSLSKASPSIPPAFSDAKMAIRKPLPAPINTRLQPSDAELNGRVNHDPSMRLRSYTPTSPRSPRSPPFTGPDSHSEAEEIAHSPMQLAHRPALASSRDGRPAEAYSPRLILPSDTHMKPDLVSTPNNFAASIKSEAASMSTLDLPARPDHAVFKSPTLRIFPLSPAQSHERRSIVPPRSSSKDLPAFPPPVPHTLRPPPLPESPGLNVESPSIQLRALSGVSIWGDSLIQELAVNKRKTQLSAHNMQVRLPSGHPSSVSSHSVHNDEPTSSDETVRSAHQGTRSQHSRKWSNESTSSNNSSSSARSIKRTQNSLRHHHARKASADVAAVTRTATSISQLENKRARRRSLQRDAMHYDPSTHRRMPSGSILARGPVDFDQPRSGPFSPSPFDDRYVIGDKNGGTDERGGSAGNEAFVSRLAPTKPIQSLSKNMNSMRSRGASLSRDEQGSAPPAATGSAWTGTKLPVLKGGAPSLETAKAGSARVGSSKGKKSAAASRQEVLEAYYRAARVSRVLDSGANESASAPVAESAASGTAGGENGSVRSRIPVPLAATKSSPLSAKRPGVTRLGSAFAAGGAGYSKISE